MNALPPLTEEQMTRFMPKAIELHLRADSDFTKKGWGRKVKAAGGEYTEARGHTSTRFVTLPLCERGLAADLIAEFPHYRNTPVVFRGFGWRASSALGVQYVPNCDHIADVVASVEAALSSVLTEMKSDLHRREIQRVLDDERERAERKERAPLRDAYRALVAAENALRAAMDADHITSYDGLSKQTYHVRRAWEARFPGEDIEAWR